MFLAAVKYLKNIQRPFVIDQNIALPYFLDHIYGDFAAIISADPYFAGTVVLPC